MMVTSFARQLSSFILMRKGGRDHTNEIISFLIRILEGVLMTHVFFWGDRV